MGPVRKIFSKRAKGRTDEVAGGNNQELLRAIVDNSTAVIYVKDLEGRFVLINRQFERLFHVSSGSAIGKTDRDLFPKDMADRYREFDLKVISSKTTLETEEIAPQDDGPHTYISIKSPLIDKTGKPYGVFGISTDITDRKKIEEERISHLRFLESLERIDRAIRQADNLERMMIDVLDESLSIFGSDRAWLLYPCDPSADSWSIPMERTREGYPGAFELNVTFPRSLEANEAFIEALKVDGPIAFDENSKRPLPPEISKRFSILSQVMMTIYPKHGKPWLFGMHQCSHARIWTDEELRLFKEIGRRVADGLSSLLFLKDLQAEEKALQQARAGLEDKVEELERFMKVSLGREKRIIELKEEIEKLKKSLKAA